MAMDSPIIFVDVDDTFVRSYGSKRIPIPGIIRHLRNLKEQGATLYCWSSGGAQYAHSSASEFGIDELFTDFLPKPQVLIDDMNINEWKDLIQVHPNESLSMELTDYVERLKK
jgi:hypothetical protein